MSNNIFKMKRKMMQLNQPETPKPPTKESLEKKSKVSEYFIFLEAQSLKRFKSLQQKPF